MVKGQMLSQKELMSAGTEERDAMLKNTYGITDEELEQVRGMETRYERMVSAAQMLFDKSGDPKQLTGYNVAAIAAPAREWKGQKTLVDYCCVLSEELKHEKQLREAASGLKLSSIHLLREKIGAYDGNIEEAAKAWGGKIVPSNADWLRSVTIPQEIDYATSQFLGMFWGDGECCHYSNRDSTRMSGRGCDKEFYENVVSEAAKMLFNMESPVRITEHTQPLRGKERDCERYLVEINSRAVTAWMVECLGFPKAREKLKFNLPKVDYDKQAFLEGLFATRGVVDRHRNENKIRDTVSYEITSKDGLFIEAVKGLLNELGYSPKGTKGKNDGVYHLHIRRKADMERIQIINPRHRKIIEEVEKNNRPDPDSPLLSSEEAKSFLAEGLTSRQVFERFNVDPAILGNAAVSNGKRKQYEEARAAEA